MRKALIKTKQAESTLSLRGRDRRADVRSYIRMYDYSFTCRQKPVWRGTFAFYIIYY